MRKIVECVPNFSEGKRKEVIDKIVSAILSVPNVFLLDVETNPDHNRSVITFIGEPESCLEAAFRATKVASELIDLTKHKGEHPRIGATDVIPFVPISGITMEECVELAKKLGKRIADELNIPVYLYEQAATRPDRVDLANIRKGEFEGLKEEIEKNPERAPDFGKPKLHPTAGATVVGARFPLIAYNINLNTTDLNIAKNIAKAIRFKDGGLRYVKALGFEIKEKNCVQVSINMTNYLQTPLYRVFEMVKREAERYGVMIRESEIVGLVPLKALIDTAVYYLQLDTFKENQILELRLPETKSLAGFLGEVASPSPTPGGGAVSALAANLGTSLLIMVCNLTIGKKAYLEYEDKMKELRSKLDVYAQRFYNLIQLDCDAFNRVMDAFKLPKEDMNRDNKIEEALKNAITVPFEVMEKSLEVLKLSSFIAEYGNKNAISDCGVGVNLLYSAMKGAYYNVLINLISLKDEEFKKEKKEKSLSYLKEGEELLKELEEKIFKRFS
ncbi:MAG: glutamate formimidoyltransferase [candidate division WOR-3 bacterium]|nr:glutamate formimidoyltransferase [candidate division WOR-3 bacterium]MCX7836670.1 glutamate formimidoyltransferase [candidate division WOR-3 bacterium]MDW8113689.1 glutamate formimidoyltransferase [candidate division WOR-3 bacterium]